MASNEVQIFFLNSNLNVLYENKLVSWSLTSLFTFQHKYGYIRDDCMKTKTLAKNDLTISHKCHKYSTENSFVHPQQLKTVQNVPGRSSSNRICSDSLCSEHPAAETYTAATVALFGSREQGQNQDTSCSPSHHRTSNTLERLDREIHSSEFLFHTYYHSLSMHLLY